MRPDLQRDTATWFQSLNPVEPSEMVGLWRGAGVPSGHPLDGVLENLQWFGKRFHGDMRADALLFQWQPGRLVAIDPRVVPIRFAMTFASFGRTILARKLFSQFQNAFRARGTTAVLGVRTFAGAASAAMIYDAQPIVDHFRRVDHDTIAGMMCLPGDERRLFFKLTKLGEQG